MNKVKQLQSLDLAGALGGIPKDNIFYLESLDSLFINSMNLHAMVLVVATPAYLMVIPRQGYAPAVLDRLCRISRNMTVFSQRELSWTYEVRLKQDFLCTLLRALQDEQSVSDDTGIVYIYINGGFQKRYFPAVLAQPQFTRDININRTFAQRLYNPKTSAIAKSFGKHSVANLIVHYDSAGGSCSCFDNTLNVIGIGRGSTKQALLLGAIYEYLERRVSGELPLSLHRAALTNMERQCLSPADLYECSEADYDVFFPQFKADQPIEWVEGVDALSHQAVWLPAAMVFYLDAMLPKFSFNTNSNGCALGNAPAEAVYYALLELIERDALLVTWYTRSAPIRILVDDTMPANALAMIKMMECEGYLVHLFDISNDSRTPVVLAVLEGQTHETMAAFVTGSAHTNPLTALESAVAEAYSLFQICGRNFLNQKHQTSALKQGNTEQYFEYASAENKDKFNFILSTPNSQSFSHFLQIHWHPQEATAPFALLLSHLDQAGYRPVYIENTPSYLQDLGLHWVRAYVPGFINLVFGNKPVFVSPERISRAAAHQSWINNQPVDSHPILHPLG